MRKKQNYSINNYFITFLFIYYFYFNILRISFIYRYVKTK